MTTEGANRTAMVKNWADEIDDLHLDSTQKRLQAIFFARTRKVGVGAAASDELMPGGGALQRGASSGDAAH